MVMRAAPTPVLNNITEQSGFMQSEVGLIPTDWECDAIHEHIDLLTGFPFPSAGYSDFGIRLLRGSNVKRNCTDWSERIVQYWPELSADIRQYELCDGDIVVAMDGSLVGRSFAVLTQEDLPALLLQRVARIRSRSISQAYLSKWVCSDYFTKHCDSVKTVTAIPHISPADIRAFKIAFPSTVDEQEAIAKALSDADALIESLEALIAKKRAIKQGAMQDLLSGRKRLPGFNGDWKRLPLSEIGDVLNGLTYAPTDVRSDGILVLRSSNIQNELLCFEDNVFVQMNVPPQSLVEENDILICVRNGSRELIGKSARIDPRCAGMAFGAFMAVFRTTYHKYVLQYFRSDHMRKQIAEHLGATINQITNKSLKSFDILMPPTKDEADAVAEVLGDFDTDISASVSKLATARHIKQGMMQELLTGRVRLV